MHEEAVKMTLIIIRKTVTVFIFLNSYFLSYSLAKYRVQTVTHAKKIETKNNNKYYSKIPSIDQMLKMKKALVRSLKFWWTIRMSPLNNTSLHTSRENYNSFPSFIDHLKNKNITLTWGKALWCRLQGRHS